MIASFYDVLHKCSNDWLKYVLVQSQCGILWSSISLEEKINILGFLHRDNYQIVSKSITVGYVWPFRSSQATICHRNVTLKNSSEFVGIKAKGWISERVFQENKASQIFRKTNISYPLIRKHFLPPDTHTYVCVLGGKKCSFFGKFSVLCFLETPVLRLARSPYYQRIMCEIFHTKPSM